MRCFENIRFAILCIFFGCHSLLSENPICLTHHWEYLGISLAICLMETNDLNLRFCIEHGRSHTDDWFGFVMVCLYTGYLQVCLVYTGFVCCCPKAFNCWRSSFRNSHCIQRNWGNLSWESLEIVCVQTSSIRSWKDILYILSNVRTHISRSKESSLSQIPSGWWKKRGIHRLIPLHNQQQKHGETGTLGICCHFVETKWKKSMQLSTARAEVSRPGSLLVWRLNSFRLILRALPFYGPKYVFLYPPCLTLGGVEYQQTWGLMWIYGDMIWTWWYGIMTSNFLILHVLLMSIEGFNPQPTGTHQSPYEYAQLGRPRSPMLRNHAREVLSLCGVFEAKKEWPSWNVENGHENTMK